MIHPGFTRGNRYLFSKRILTWNLPSGHTCPGAKACLAYTNRDTGSLTLGPHSEFKCYSAVTERFPAVRDKAWANRDLVFRLDADAVTDAILALLPDNAQEVRVHAAGDFFSQRYFDGWLGVARAKPNVWFWAFTKSLPFWINRLGQIPDNLMLTASYGGKHDALIEQHGLKYSVVVYSESEARDRGLEIDTNDWLAAYSRQPFALLENFSRSKKQRPLPMLER
jgi:hypothetical protein